VYKDKEGYAHKRAPKTTDNDKKSAISKATRLGFSMLPDKLKSVYRRR
jgi:hypothetical protein